MFDPQTIRGDFPALQGGLAYFDAPGGTLVPTPVADAMREAVTRATASMLVPGSDTPSAADTALAFRAAAAELLGADPGGIVHGRSATALAFDFARTLSKHWAEGDNIVLSDLDHDSNVSPWLIAAERAGASVRWARFDPQIGELPAEQYEALIDERTRLVAVTAASNLIGTKPDIAAISAAARAHGALVYADGVHYAAHAEVDLDELGADLLSFSPYKLFGPHFGLLAASPSLLERLAPDKLAPSPDTVPQRFELGTLPYELLAGFTASIDYLAGLSSGSIAASGSRGGRRPRILAAMREIEAHENALRERLEAGLAEMPHLTRHSRAQHRTSTTFMSLAGYAPAEVADGLRAHGIVAQAGNFYAYRACERLGLGLAGGLRFGLALYTSHGEIELLLEALAAVAPPR